MSSFFYVGRFPGFELVPFVRVGRERGTPRVNRYNANRSELERLLFADLSARRIGVPEGDHYREWSLEVLVERPRRLDLREELSSLASASDRREGLPSGAFLAARNGLGQNGDADNLGKSVLDALSGILYVDDELVRSIEVEVLRDAPDFALTIIAEAYG